jgi:hypothetical protein
MAVAAKLLDAPDNKSSVLRVARKKPVCALERPSWPRIPERPRPPKKHKQLKALQRAKMLSSYRILAPADVLAIEVWGGRDWRPAVSSGGVAIETARLRARTLVTP